MEETHMNTTSFTPRISVTFVNNFNRIKLCTTELPALPQKGDFIYLDDLPYEVFTNQWLLTSDGRLQIEIRLMPAIDQTGERPFSHPNESELAARWHKLDE
jgi:hypothetical protein